MRKKTTSPKRGNLVPVLFDCNGVFGREVSADINDCPTMSDRLEHMDRLGIGRSLVWNAEAVQHHALSCNERAIAAIAATPGATGRIIPALAVSGLMLYEEEGIERLKLQMRSTNSRALRFVNGRGNLSLAQAAPVIEAISSLKPFIVTRHNETPVQDIMSFAEQFPRIPVILTDVMWTPCLTVFEIMRRHRNVMIDISWLHTWGAIELAVRHFGAERVVFGTGYRSHNGAAIAALARAEISESDRNLIAHGNLDRLMGGASSPATESSGIRNSFWAKCLAGERLGTEIIDAHGHIGPSSGYVLEIQEDDGQLEDGARKMDSLGMDLMIVSGMQALLGEPVSGNELVAEKLRGRRDRFSAYFVFNPFYSRDLIPRLETCFRNPAFVGFKTLCSYWKIKINDPRFRPMWEFADRHRLPILSHTWGREDVRCLGEVAEKYPNAQFLVGHSGGMDDGRIEAEPLARDMKNVYLEWCGSFCSRKSWEETTDLVGSHKIVFGTDSMLHGIYWELGRLLSLDLPDAPLRMILGGNMRKILSLRR